MMNGNLDKNSKFDVNLPRFCRNAVGKHVEHCAAISVDGWQITVPITTKTTPFLSLFH